MTATYALDATPILGNRTGIGRFVEELVAGLTDALRDDEELLLVAGTSRLNPLFGVSHEPLRRAARHARVRTRRLWLPFRLAEALWSRSGACAAESFTGPLAVYHGTSYLLPACRAAAGVVTVHDLATFRHPETVPPAFAECVRRIVTAALPRAEVVVADSAATADDLRELFGVEARVIPLGVGGAFFERGDPAADRARLADRYGVAFPTVLFVGTTNPRKNLRRLLEAFAAVRGRRDLPHRLVLVGDPGFDDAAVHERIAALGLAGAVHVPGYVDEADLPAFYRTADALAFPSLHEGFGLPVLEAMASGCPVLTSSTSSLPEVAGDAATLVEPTSTDDVAAGLERVLTDGDLTHRLRERGRARALEFGWERVARSYLDLYRELAA